MEATFEEQTNLNHEQCVSDFAKIYIQYNCDFSDLVGEQQNLMMLITFTIFIVGGLFSYMIYYLQISAQLNYKLWDMKLKTVADFTVQLTITQDIWQAWQFHCRRFKISQDKFKDFLSKEIEE